MRGITSAGMGLALAQLGLTDAFDVVYGASAGAFNGAYFVSRQGPFGITIYYEEINNRRFINLLRPLCGQPAVSLDYLFDVAMTSKKPLDFDAFSHSQIPLRVLASNLTLRKTTIFDTFLSREDLFLKLRASSAMPFLTGPPVNIDGELYSDASLYESIPLRSAINLSASICCSHVLVLRSRPMGAVREPLSFIHRNVIGNSLRRCGDELYSDLMRTPQIYAEDLALLSKNATEGDSGPYLYQVATPSGTPVVSHFERRRDELVQAASAGMKAMIRALTGEEATVEELIMPLRQNGRSFDL